MILDPLVRNHLKRPKINSLSFSLTLQHYTLKHTSYNNRSHVFISFFQLINSKTVCAIRQSEQINKAP